MHSISRPKAVGVCGFAVAIFIVGFAMPAVGKENTTATLLSRVPLDAKPGTRLRVAWKLETQAAQTTRSASGDDRFYVRLLSATGARSTHAFGQLRRRHYVAVVRVPRGGIGDIEIRLKGWQITPAGTRRSDALIPITNDPVPGGPPRAYGSGSPPPPARQSAR